MLADTNIQLLNARCQNCAIRHHAVCAALNDEELTALNKISRQKIIKAGDTIVSDTEQVDFFANVISGVVKLTKTMADGREQIVGLLFPSDFLGRAYRAHHTYFAEAATDVSLCCFPHDGFEHLLKKFPDLEHRLFSSTLDELDSAREWMLLLGRKTAEEKVANFLLMLAKRSRLQECGDCKSEKISFELPLTRMDIADYLGLTIETVSRQLSKLKKRSIITLLDNRHIEIDGLQNLAEAAGEDIP